MISKHALNYDNFKEIKQLTETVERHKNVHFRITPESRRFFNNVPRPPKFIAIKEDESVEIHPISKLHDTIRDGDRDVYISTETIYNLLQNELKSGASCEIHSKEPEYIIAAQGSDMAHDYDENAIDYLPYFRFQFTVSYSNGRPYETVHEKVRNAILDDSLVAPMPTSFPESHTLDIVTFDIFKKAEAGDLMSFRVDLNKLKLTLGLENAYLRGILNNPFSDSVGKSLATNLRNQGIEYNESETLARFMKQLIERVSK